MKDLPLNPPADILGVLFEEHLRGTIVSVGEGNGK